MDGYIIFEAEIGWKWQNKICTDKNHMNKKEKRHHG